MPGYYTDAVEQKAIQDFVLENSRAPSKEELVILLREYERRYANAPEIGFAGLDTEKVNFKEYSSAAIENANRAALLADMKVFSKQLDKLMSDMELDYRIFQAALGKTNRLLGEVDQRVSNLVLMNSKADAFLYGIEENLATQEFVDFDLTTATLDVGFLTLERQNRTTVDLDRAVLSSDMVSDVGAVSATVVGTIERLKYQDGNTWQLLGYTNFKRGRVTARLDLEFPTLTDVSSIKLFNSPVNGNSQMVCTVLYSLDGENFIRTTTQEETLVQGANQFEVGASSVKKLVLLFSKTAADNETDVAGQYVYAFGFDSIEILDSGYLSKKRSEAVFGPYTVTDEVGLAVNFNRATVEACVSTPVGTGVSFLLSKDAANWFPVAHTNNALAAVAFGADVSAASASTVDATETRSLLAEAAKVDLNFQFDAVLNTYVDSTWFDRVIRRSVSIRRGTPVSTLTNSGWVKTTGGYKTVLEVTLPEGQYLDLGNTSAYVNGNLVSGLIQLKTGFSTFETSDSNWRDVTKNLANINLLRQSDPLYPYNHKYLIEGYSYPVSFVGERAYQGMSAYFSRLLQYVSPEKFNATENYNNYDIYTIEDDELELYFKVKVDKTQADWQDEVLAASWVVQDQTGSSIYVKILLNTEDINISPRVDSFNVRVI